MEKQKPVIGSKHKEAIDELATAIARRNYELGYGLNETGICFVWSSSLYDKKMDSTMRVVSQDSNGRLVIDKYRISNASFLHLVEMTRPYREWKGF